MNWFNFTYLIGIFFCFGCVLFWIRKNRKFQSALSVAAAYDQWTNDQLLEKLWGEHVHLGFYEGGCRRKDFRTAKVDFVHELVKWSGLDRMSRGSRILDVGCGIGGSARILAKEYGFDVIGITISQKQANRAAQLTPVGVNCRFEVMDALDIRFDKGSFDGVWSVEAGPHMLDKQKYADEMLRVLRPGGILAVADWNKRNTKKAKLTTFERIIMRQLLDQWSHPDFSSIDGFCENLLSSKFYGGGIYFDDWTSQTLPSWHESILEGFRRPNDVLSLGPNAIIKGLREVPTILLMRWAFVHGLMRFGVFRARG